MIDFAPASCIPDDGIEARIPGSPFAVLTLVEIRNRLSDSPEISEVTPDVLRDSMNLSLAQVYAALAYYHANQAAFDAELARRREVTQKSLEELSAKNEGKLGWAGIWGMWPGDETDEEIAELLERIS